MMNYFGITEILLQFYSACNKNLWMSLDLLQLEENYFVAFKSKNTQKWNTSVHFR